MGTLGFLFIECVYVYKHMSLHICLYTHTHTRTHMLTQEGLLTMGVGDTVLRCNVCKALSWGSGLPLPSDLY